MALGYHKLLYKYTKKSKTELTNTKLYTTSKLVLFLRV